jgi:hypothetical protein
MKAPRLRLGSPKQPGGRASSVVRTALIVGAIPLLVAAPLFLWPPVPCFPTDQTCYLTDRAAAVSTSNATWWMFLATTIGASATLAAVLVALSQDRRRSQADDRERTRLNAAAQRSILSVNAFCRDVNEIVSRWNRAEINLAWDFFATSEAHRRTLEHFLRTTITNDELVYFSNAAIQRLYELNAALNFILKEHPPQLDSAKGALASAVRRIDIDEPDVASASVDVVDGVTRVRVRARASIAGRSSVSGGGSLSPPEV